MNRWACDKERSQEKGKVSMTTDDRKSRRSGLMVSQ